MAGRIKLLEGLTSMAIYRNIHMSFWTDSKIIDDFSPEEKYLYLYLMTNPHTNLAGCYEISIKQAIYETGYASEKIMKLIDQLERVHNIIRYSKDTKEILLLNWSKYNWTSSEKFRKPLAEELKSIKDDDFKRYLVDIFNGEENVDTVPVKGDTVSEKKDTVSETPKPVLKPQPLFKPPTLEEVEAYCTERNNKINAQQFIDFYSSKGWMVGKNKMKDWKACVRTWEQRNNDSGQVKTSAYMQSIKDRVNIVDTWD